MLSNHLYNLMLQLTEESKSLHRIKNEYANDSSDCADCKMLWEKLAKQKEETVDELTSFIKTHMDQG